jgi:hypothetical protein
MVRPLLVTRLHDENLETADYADSADFFWTTRGGGVDD